MAKDKQQKPPLIFYGIILGFIILVGLNFAGDYNLRETVKDDSGIVNVLNGILIRVGVLESDRDFHDRFIIDLGKNVTALKSYDEIITTQIGNIKSDIKSKFPQASKVETTEQTSITSTTPFLTLKMEQREFSLGNTIFFSGAAQPNNPIFLTLKDPTRELWQIPISKTEIINGAYMANYTLRLDDPIGTWSVYARQLSDTTKTLTFKVE